MTPSDKTSKDSDFLVVGLDEELRICFYTPEIRMLFNIIPGDIGRPLSNLSSLVADDDLFVDAGSVLRGQTSVERELLAVEGSWFCRRILPYRSHDEKIEGVVVIYTDVTRRKLAGKVLEEARKLAERANAAKSRFLAAASHDLRQPLQTLTLLQGLLLKAIDEKQARDLVTRSQEALAAMSGMLNSLLDLNQIEAGAVKAETVSFPVSDLFEVLLKEFGIQTEARRLDLRIVPCGLSIETDPRLIEQMFRNLLSNAFKYTRQGKILLGCRRRGGRLSLEVWDTGIGIPNGELQAIFEEYHQVGNASRDRSHGLGLGLAIVQRLADLIGHDVKVRSQQGKGSVFAIEADLSSGAEPASVHVEPRSGNPRPGTVLIIEDDVEVREVLQLYLQGEGHRVTAVEDGVAAMHLVATGAYRPDLILADHSLPGGMNGLEIAASLRETLQRNVPVVILTGDISVSPSSEGADRNCVRLNKPVKPHELTRLIEDLLPAARPLKPPAPRHASTGAEGGAPVIFVVDDDGDVRDAIRRVLEDGGRVVADFASCEAFLDAFRPGGDACLLIDASLPGMDGFGLLKRLAEMGNALPAVMITGKGDVAMAVRAMKAGASDFIEKPIAGPELFASVERALEQARDAGKRQASRHDASGRLASLTPRQRQIMDLVLAGHPSKNIAADLGISQRTIENHRATIMRKTGSKSMPALAHLSFTATDPGDETHS